MENTNQNTEQQILEVAENLFLTNGFAATSTTEIAREVGCNQALIHYYFRTKDNLFNTIFEKKFKEFFEPLLDIFNNQNLSFANKLIRFIEGHFDLVSRNPRLPQLIINEILKRPDMMDKIKEKLRPYPARIFPEFAKELQAEIDKGHIRPIDSVDLTMTIISMNVSFFLFMPVVSKVIGLDEDAKKDLIAHRRPEHISFIMNSLRP